jgi:glycosyltransferase involved in cell wall biosynthesis
MINNSTAGALDYARWLGISPTRFVIKRNGLDTMTIVRRPSDAVADLRKRLGIPAQAEIVGSMFRFHNEKRPHLWVETASEIAKRRPRCHFVIFGDGPLRQDTEALGERLGLTDRLHCPGTIADAALGLSLFDVFLLTSRFEGTPNTVLEASCLGIPVVATDAGGTRETINHGVTGLLATQAAAGEIAAQVIEILSSPQWRSQVTAEGPAFVERCFGLKRMISETFALHNLPMQ